MPSNSSLGYHVAPLGGAGVPGVMVTGLSVEALGHTEMSSSLRDLWREHGLILFRGLEGTESHLALSRCFGKLTRHPSGVSHNPLHPELSDIAYTRDDGNVVEIEGVPLAAYLPWHSDLVYFAEINRGGILRAIEPSAQGGMTGFVDKAAAWDRLPAALQAGCDRLWGVYWGDFRMESCRYARGAKTLRQSASAQRIIAKRDTFPRVAHPLACDHPESGRRMLNLSPWFIQGIEGMSDAQAHSLLDELVVYLCDEEHAYFHPWQKDDMVLWDNWRMLHSSTGVPPDGRRVMQRTTILGDYAMGRVLTAPEGSEGLERVSI